VGAKEERKRGPGGRKEGREEEKSDTLGSSCQFGVTKFNTQPGE